MFVGLQSIKGNFKNSILKAAQSSFSQSKNLQSKNIAGFKITMGSNTIENKIPNLTQNISFEITHAKRLEQTHEQLMLQAKLKKVQKTAAYVHSFNPKNLQQEDVPIRIFRTQHTVTFMPSIQFLEKEYHPQNKTGRVYHQQKDSVMSCYKFNCKHCGHKQARSFPENGYRFGTVLTGCDKCHQIVLISDHLGWIQHKKTKSESHLIFSPKNVMDLIKRNLQKVGFEASREKYVF